MFIFSNRCLFVSLCAFVALACTEKYSPPASSGAGVSSGGVSSGGVSSGGMTTGSSGGTTDGSGSTGTTSGGSGQGDTAGTTTSGTGGTTTSGTGGTTTSGTGGTTTGGTGGTTCKVISAQPPVQSGVVYVSHYHSNELKIFRVDSGTPVKAGEVDLGSVTHDMAIDSFHDLLFVAHDTETRVSVHQLYRPQTANHPLTMPAFLQDISTYPDYPRFLRVDSLRNRLFVFSSVTDSPKTMNVHVYDTSNPSVQSELPGSPFSIPVTVSMDIDTLAGVLFLITDSDEMLRLYDIADGLLTPMGGQPIPLKQFYGQVNNTSFSARNLRVDAWQGRVYAARAQTAFSEVIAFEYPPAISFDSSCPTRPYHGSLTMVDDYFDVNQPVEQRPNLLDAYMVNSDPNSGTVLFAVAAWNGKAASAMMISMGKDLKVAPGCGDFEGFGCFFKEYYEGQLKDWYQVTDGASCLDYTHKVVVGTSYVPQTETDPGQVFFWKYDDMLNLSPMMPSGGGAFVVGGLPTTAVCH